MQQPQETRAHPLSARGLASPTHRLPLPLGLFRCVCVWKLYIPRNACAPDARGWERFARLLTPVKSRSEDTRKDCVSTYHALSQEVEDCDFTHASPSWMHAPQAVTNSPGSLTSKVHVCERAIFPVYNLATTAWLVVSQLSLLAFRASYFTSQRPFANLPQRRMLWASSRNSWTLPWPSSGGAFSHQTLSPHA